MDFTAAWCVTCLANKRVYSADALATAFRRHDVALLRADWTRKNPAIAAALAGYKRAAIPFNVFLKNGLPAPVVLPEVLTEGAVLQGLRRALANPGEPAPGQPSSS
ncbi:MAG: thioredoxin family protein, partial [Puniceicoccales bacterium]|nr:thioredoxin family protein [Puniceicoccales bacterium]